MTDHIHDPVLKLTEQASELAVRTMLLRLRAWVESQTDDQDFCGTVEIAVAEVLNNVVEHAYAGRPPAAIDLDARLFDDHLHVIVMDFGNPLPGLKIPPGQLPEATTVIDDLPEGGFGWFLIRNATRRLTYVRSDNGNRLLLEFSR